MSGENTERIKQVVDELFRKHDKNNDQEIDRDEARNLFAELFTMQYGTSVVDEYGTDAEKVFQNTFDVVDKDGDGLLSKEEMYSFYNGMLNGETAISKQDATSIAEKRGDEESMNVQVTPIEKQPL